MEVFAGGAAAHGLGLNTDCHQGHAAAVEHAGLVADAQLARAAAAHATRCLRTHVHVHLSHVHLQEGLQLQTDIQRDRGREKKKDREGKILSLKMIF